MSLPPVDPPSFPIPDVVTYAIPFFVVSVIAEMIWVRLSKKGAYQAADSASSLLMGFGNTVTTGAFLGVLVVLFSALYEYRLFNIPWTWWGMALCFFAEDFCYYWFHRISHERRWFWASHNVHHTSQHYNLSAALRQSWTNVVGFTFIFWLPLMLIGFPPAMVFLFQGISLVYQYWIHTESIKRMGPFEWLFNTPSHHRVHHAVNPRYLDANYAGVLIIWDRLFGTFVPELDEDKPRYGVITNLTTFNPFRIAFHEWAGIFKDVSKAKSLKDAVGYMFGPPGWSPDGSRKTSQSIKAEWEARQAKAPPVAPEAVAAE